MRRRVGRSYGLACLFFLGFAGMAEAAGDGELTRGAMVFVVELGVIVLATRVGSVLARRWRMPGVLGEVAAGVLIGPAVLGHLPLPGFPVGLFPPGDGFPVSAQLYGICALAAVVLLFRVGLETDLRLLARFSVAGLVVGVAGVVVSFVLGDWVTVLFAPMLFGARLGFFAPPCLFLGLIATATSVGITARILAEKRKLDSPEGVTILAGAVIDDILGIILLAVVLGLAGGTGASGSIDWGHVGGVAGKAFGIWLLATAVGLAASRRIGALLKLSQDPLTIALTAMGLALILAGLFEAAGLAMIVGAYVMGLSLSHTDINHLVREKLDPLYRFLVPVFFCVMGMLLDLRLLASRPVLLFGVAYAAAAVAAKLLGCGLAVLPLNFNSLGALRVGFGMMPRCEVALTMAGIGLARGVIPREVVGVAVLLMFVTTFAAPPALAGLFSSRASGIRRPVPDTDTTTLPFAFPSPAIVELLTPKLLDVFRAEGFFAHELDPQERIYQLRKDAMVIGLRLGQDEISFRCRPADVPLVNAAMYEVVADLQRTVAALQKPVDRDAIARKVQDAGPAIPRGFNLGTYLNRRALVPRLQATTKEGVIDELLAVLADAGLIQDVAGAKQAVWAREQDMSTGMQHGIAIPHGRTDGVSRLVCAVGLKGDGLDFDAIDGEPSRIFVLTLSPRGRAAPHVQCMSAIGQVLNEVGRAKLLACRTADEMYRVLNGETIGSESFDRALDVPEPELEPESEPEPATEPEVAGPRQGRPRMRHRASRTGSGVGA
ncbi:MAG: cation:proton antiporter [Kiritimatiellae bacterium]|nr:cation:proton antiporter [Kiritimatiellia bacterium]